MFKPDIFVSKIKFKEKLKDRKRIKGYSFSYSNKDNKIESTILKEYRKERKERKALNEKEYNILRNNLNKIRKKIINLEQYHKKEGLFTQLDNNKFNSISTFRDDLTKFERKKKKIVEDYKERNNKTKLQEKYELEDIKDMIMDIKNLSFNFYQAMTNINMKEKISEKKDKKSIKFYKDFLNKFREVGKTSSSQNYIKKCSKIHFNDNIQISNRTKNLNLYYSLLLQKQINPIINHESEKKVAISLLDKNSEDIYKNMTMNNISLNDKTTVLNETSSLIKRYNNMNKIKRPVSHNILYKKNKMNLKKVFVINKPIYYSNYKYFFDNFQKIKAKIKKNQLKRKEGHLTSYTNIEKYSKIREDMLMFRLKTKYLNTRFPKRPEKPIDKRKLLAQKLFKDFGKKNEKSFNFEKFDVKHYK